MEFTELLKLLQEDRSIRRFDGEVVLPYSTMESLVELTRWCASGRNLQPLRYRIVADREEAASIYPYLKWAGYLPEWDGPAECERPNNYLVQCIDTQLTDNCMCDDGLHLQAITLGARVLGMGCCIIKSFDPAKVAEVLGISERYRPHYIIAIGKGVEQVEVIDTDGTTGANIRYYRREDATHVVPKRPLKEIIL
ncbi:MAG: nitroreductase family protein [Lepagella sp.]